MITTLPAAVSIAQAFRKFGGPGLVIFGLIDASPVPIPGSIDALTIYLSATNRQDWLYYAVMSMIGSELGGYISYRVAQKAGEEAIRKKLGPQRAQRLHELIEKWEFGAVAVSAMMPPPFPVTPFLLFSGATNYPLKKFLAALATGRAVKYTLLAYLASVYGRHFLYSKVGQFQSWVTGGLIVLGLIGITLLVTRAYLRTQSSQEHRAAHH